MTQVNQVLPKASTQNALLLAEALKPVSQQLEELRSCINGFIPLSAETSRELTDHVFSSHGKLLRPSLFFLASKLCDYSGDQLYPIAAVCEFIHTASLLHDDVVDNSKLRRNKPTANRIWGDESAVLVGDLIYSRASEMMAESGKLEIVSTFAAAIRHMSEGELLQLEHLYSYNIPEKIYFKILEGKTAVLMGAICKAAGSLAECSVIQKEALRKFGYSLGVSFQLMDDALDYKSTQSTFGKDVLSDLKEGKVTLPIILLREKASVEELTLLQNIISKEAIKSEDIAAVVSMVERYKTSEQTIERANFYTKEALSALDEAFPHSQARMDMELLATSLLFRVK